MYTKTDKTKENSSTFLWHGMQGDQIGQIYAY
jgi:hypothetical protein